MTKEEIVQKAMQVVKEWAQAEVHSDSEPLRIELQILTAGIRNPDYSLDVKRKRLIRYEHEQFS